MIELQREPTHPGEILKEEFLEPMGITQTKLAKYFGTSPELWLNLQNSYDLYKVLKKKKSLIESIEPVKEVA